MEQVAQVVYLHKPAQAVHRGHGRRRGAEPHEPVPVEEQPLAAVVEDWYLGPEDPVLVVEEGEVLPVVPVAVVAQDRVQPVAQVLPAARLGARQPHTRPSQQAGFLVLDGARVAGAVPVGDGDRVAFARYES